MITLANGTGGGVFSAPRLLPRADDRASGTHRQDAPQALHYDLALAIQTHRSAQLAEMNRQLAATVVRAQAQLAAAEQSRLQQTEFLAVVAHELRNPLTPIRTAADMLGRGQQLVVVVPAHPIEVDADPVRLIQVLGNLLDNACKYTPDGGTIELLAGVAGDLVVMSVSDTGVGIAPDTLPHVFEPFAQGLPGDGVGAAGLGLGLAVVRELVEAHGGTVAAHSAGRGRGSLFVVTLPRSAARFDVGAGPGQCAAR